MKSCDEVASRNTTGIRIPRRCWHESHEIRPRRHLWPISPSGGTRFGGQNTIPSNVGMDPHAWGDEALQWTDVEIQTQRILGYSVWQSNIAKRQKADVG